MPPITLKHDALINLHPLHKDRQQAESIIQSIYAAKRIIIVTGAGISVSGGIPDFRSIDGLYNIVKEKYPNVVVKGKDIFDARIFSDSDSMKVFYLFMSQLKHIIDESKCTPVHHFIKRMSESKQLMRCYTQNIDCLEARLGMESELFNNKSKVIMLHGSMANVVCTICKHKYPFEESIRDTFSKGQAPKCTQCSEKSALRAAMQKRTLPLGNLRPDIILYNEHHSAGDWIGEMVAKDLSKRPDMLIVMGTSLKVTGIKKLVKDFAKLINSSSKSGDFKTLLINKCDVSSAEWDNVFTAKWLGNADDIVKFIEKGVDDRIAKATQRRNTRQSKENTNNGNQVFISDMLPIKKQSRPAKSVATTKKEKFIEDASHEVKLRQKASETKPIELLARSKVFVQLS